MQDTWVMVANAARARCFERHKADGTLRERADYVHPQSRQKGIDLGSDRSGHVDRDTRAGAGSGTPLDARTDPRAKEHDSFARQLAKVINDAVAGGRCGALVLVASNPFLGELKSHLSPRADHLLQATIPSDLTSFEGHDLQRRIDRALGPD
jgi:protein required for attachment to host cells